MVGAKPADTVSSLYAELAEPVREAANPVCKLTVSTAPLPVDQRGLIGRDACSPLDQDPTPRSIIVVKAPTPPTNAGTDPTASFEAKLVKDADQVTRTERRLDPFSRAPERTLAQFTVNGQLYPCAQRPSGGTVVRRWRWNQVDHWVPHLRRPACGRKTAFMPPRFRAARRGQLVAIDDEDDDRESADV